MLGKWELWAFDFDKNGYMVELSDGILSMQYPDSTKDTVTEVKAMTFDEVYAMVKAVVDAANAA